MRIIQTEQVDNLTRIFVDFTAKIIMPRSTPLLRAPVWTLAITVMTTVVDDKIMNGGAFDINIGAIVGAAIGSAVGGALVGNWCHCRW